MVKLSQAASTDQQRPKGPLFEASEWRQIILVLMLAALTLFGIAVLYGRNSSLATTFLSVIGMHLAAARAPAVLFCLARGLSPMSTLLVNFYIEVIIVVLSYYLFVLLVREGLESKFLRLAAKQAETAAQKHRDRLKRFELAGLFFIVMAPIPMTGPCMGAIVGYLLNLRPWVTFSIVLSGTFVALGAYVLIGQAVLVRIIEFQNEYQETATIVIAILIAGFTIFHVHSIAGWVKDSVSEHEK